MELAKQLFAEPGSGNREKKKEKRKQRGTTEPNLLVKLGKHEAISRKADTPWRPGGID